jgi:hypothetical protein
MVKCMPRHANICLAQAIISGMVKMCGYLLQGCQVYCHASQDKEKIVQSLESHGISRFHGRIGGSWSYERFSGWLIERAQMDRERRPEKCFSATQTVPGVATALLTSTTPSDDDDYKPRRTEPSGDAGLDNAPAITSPTGGAAYLVVTDDDDSRADCVQPDAIIKRKEMYQNFRNQ